MTVRLIGVSGSLRAGSFNTALLNAAQRLAPADVELITGTINGQGVISGAQSKPTIAACPICLAAGTLIDAPSGPIPVQNLEVGKQAARDGIAAWTPQRLFALFPNLGEMPDRPGGSMSGGEQQMLTVARTLMGNPLLVMLDEQIGRAHV